MTITEKVAYIKGLCAGLGFEKNSKEAKVFKAIIDALDDMALSICDLEDGLEELSEQVDAIDEDLDALEGDYYEAYEDDDACTCGDDCDCDGLLYVVTCEACGEEISLDEGAVAEGSINCPGCGELLEFEEDEDEDLDDDDDSDDDDGIVTF